MAQDKGVGMGQTWEQRRGKKKTGEEERNGQDSASLSADTDQEHKKCLEERGCLSFSEIAQAEQTFEVLISQFRHCRPSPQVLTVLVLA